MKNSASIKKVLCAILAISMCFSAGISAFAEYPGAAADPKADGSIKSCNNKQYLEEAVQKLVQEGKLSKEKADKIMEYKKRKEEEFSKLSKEEKQQLKKDRKGSLLNELKKEGVLTEEEVRLIRTKLREMKEARLNDGMQKLVDSGVLTADDINNIRNYMLKVREERKAQIEKLKSMTPEQRKEYFDNSKRDKKDILTRMVEDKVITKEQAEEIRKAIPELSRKKRRR